VAPFVEMWCEVLVLLEAETPGYHTKRHFMYAIIVSVDKDGDMEHSSVVWIVSNKETQNGSELTCIILDLHKSLNSSIQYASTPCAPTVSSYTQSAATARSPQHLSSSAGTPPSHPTATTPPNATSSRTPSSPTNSNNSARIVRIVATPCSAGSSHATK